MDAPLAVASCHLLQLRVARAEVHHIKWKLPHCPQSMPPREHPTVKCNHTHLRYRLEHRQLRHLGGRATLRSHLGGNGGSIIVLIELWRAGPVCKTLYLTWVPWWHRAALVAATRAQSSLSVVALRCSPGALLVHPPVPCNSQPPPPPNQPHLHLPPQHRLAPIPEGVHLHGWRVAWGCMPQTHAAMNQQPLFAWGHS